MGTAPGLGERQRARCGGSGRHRSPSSQHPAGSLPAAVLGEAGHLPAHTCTATAHLAPLHTRGGDSNWRARDGWDGRGRQAGGAWGQDGGTGRKEGRDAASAGRIPPSPCLFPLGKKKGRLFPAWIFFPASLAAAGGTPSQATPSPWQRAERNRWSWRAKSQFEGEQRRGAGRAGAGPGHTPGGDREVSPLTLISLVLQLWQGVRRLGATSGWPHRREGRARCPPKGNEPSETHHPVSWTSLATGRAASSQTSPASPCPPLANLTP